jgi:uncharacterized protein YegP (UPF0339 family)
MRYVVELYEDVRGAWRWRLVAENGRIVGDSSEGYVDRSHAETMATQIFGGDAEIVLRFPAE